ncbi:MAG: DJ-1/PfpI family protein [Lentisphaerae bacterium]|jgi:4-methyl-5(b-hydroxyethyl)-thiazole monophosphate biosynthesis|nr:DJ-1/PfpI family protein [Lentisphaerota bacterium]
MSEKAIALLLAPGFEEIEAVTPIDVLRRAGFTVKVAAVGGNKGTVVGAHGIPIVCDCDVSDLKAETLQMVILPGGLPGATNLAASTAVCSLLKVVHDQGGWATALCAAPLVLQTAGVLADHTYTCYPSFEQKIGGKYSGKRVERDRRIVTGCGPGASLEFALELVRCLGKRDVAEQLAKGMLAG